MQAHLDQELSLMTLGTVVQMSPYYFSQLFKQSAGLSPHQYLLHQRVERAKHLLADPRRRIADVSQEVGIAAQSHVTTVFRTLLGTTPRTYQRQRGGEYKSGKIPQIPHEFERTQQGVWNRIQLGSGRLLIHEKPDTYCPQGEDHDCSGGGRAACGIIEAVEK